LEVTLTGKKKVILRSVIQRPPEGKHEGEHGKTMTHDAEATPAWNFQKLKNERAVRSHHGGL
jgi:hypothetical protein